MLDRTELAARGLALPDTESVLLVKVGTMMMMIMMIVMMMMPL